MVCLLMDLYKKREKIKKEKKNVKKRLHFYKLSFIILLALLIKHIRNAPLAQLEEHLTLNQGVQGSSP